MNSRAAPRALWVVIGVGTVVRLGIAFKSTGTFIDLESLATVQRGLTKYGLHVYSAVNGNVSR